MADYRDLAIALGGGYGQDTGPITADTLITLKERQNGHVLATCLECLKVLGKRLAVIWNHWVGAAYQHFWVRLWIPQTRLGHLTQWKCLGM
jgi:hypothetical protein